MLIWVTGLSGAGKTTLAVALYGKLKKKLSNLVLLDGDQFREMMSSDVGYDHSDRLIMAWRMAKICQCLTAQSIHVICATISMYKEIHMFNRANIKDYYEVFIDVSLDNLIKNDKKGLYSGALSKKIHNVVGVDLPFDRPENCDLIIDNNKKNALKEKVGRILHLIEKSNDKLNG
ncbi:MAG: adenylyl-sulfate kinase [Puniceicoccales bacterium]|jgi:adenylylsulfate kinase-like enzyme|nr:adenylyl-sulfate kinase [Puniceicoccales bacterium]